MQLKVQLEQHRQRELQEVQQQQQERLRQLEGLFEQQPQGSHDQQPQPPQGLETGKEEQPLYGPVTPVWLRLGGPTTIPAKPWREDGVVALACAMRMPVDPSSAIKGSLYGIEGIAPGFLEGRQPWEDLSADGADEAGTSGGGEVDETGTWTSVDDDGRFPSLIDLFLHHGGSLETVQELIRASRRVRRRRWSTGVFGGSAFEPLLHRMSPIS